MHVPINIKLTHASENLPDSVFSFEDWDNRSRCQTTLPHISEESFLHGHRRENLISHVHHPTFKPFVHLIRNTWAGKYTIALLSLIRYCSL